MKHHKGHAGQTCNNLPKWIRVFDGRIDHVRKMKQHGGKALQLLWISFIHICWLRCMA